MLDVSVIVPTYNRPALLQQALESLEAQTVDGFEAVVVNDGGQDVRHVVASFPFARYVALPENRGLPAARNAGLTIARGRYIAYLDDDDQFYPMHLEILLRTLEKTGTRAAYSDAHIQEPGQAPRVYMSRDYSHVALRQLNLFPVCCVMHERSLFDRAGVFDEELANHEDWDLWLRMAPCTDFYHVPVVTCLIDRTRPTMDSDRETMLAGYDLVWGRYRREALA